MFEIDGQLHVDQHPSKLKTSKDFGILILAKNRRFNRFSCHILRIAHPIENYRCTTQDAPQSAKISDFQRRIGLRFDEGRNAFRYKMKL